MPFQLPIVDLGRGLANTAERAAGRVSRISDAFGQAGRERETQRERRVAKEQERQEQRSQQSENERYDRLDRSLERLPGQAAAVSAATQPGLDAENRRTMTGETHKTNLAGQLDTTTTGNDIRKIGAQAGFAGQLYTSTTSDDIRKLDRTSQHRITEAEALAEIQGRARGQLFDNTFRLQQGLLGGETAQLGMLVGSDPNNSALNQILSSERTGRQDYLAAAERIMQSSKPSPIRQGFDLVKGLGLAYLASRI